MQYKKPDDSDIGFLRRVCPANRVLSGSDIGSDYSHDEMTEYGCFMPDVVVEVESAEEISKVLKYAFEKHIAVTPRGSGTGLCGGAVPVFGGIVLSLLRMNRVLEIDEENLTVTVEPGLLLSNLISVLADRKLFYPPDPGEKSATLGGNVMTNAGGMRAVKYGVTRDYVRGLEAVLPNGELAVFGGKTVKNSSGYALKDLIIGSEGTLAIITKIILKVLPLPQKTVSLLVPFETLEECIGAVPAILLSKAAPTAVEFMQREVIEAAEIFLGKSFMDKSSDVYLLLQFDGQSAEEIERQYAEAAEVCLENGAVDVFVADTYERSEKLWDTRGAFLEAIKASTDSLDECDVVVPRSMIARFVEFTKQVKARHNLRILSFGHAGDGNIHIYVCRDGIDDAQWRRKVSDVMGELYAMAIELGGQVSGEHGIGHAKISYLTESIGSNNYAIMGAIKKVFDPDGILNPGKVCG
jgi:glycolate oxidase